MATPTASSNSTSSPNSKTMKFDPKFPATELVSNIKQEAEQAHINTLSRLANLSIPVLGATAKSSQLVDTLEQILLYADTTKFFGDALSLFQQGSLTREDLDQRLIEWAFKMPGLKEKFDDLPPIVKSCVEQFRNHNLQKGTLPTAKGFKIPPSPSTAQKSANLKAMWEAQLQVDHGEKFPSIVEKDGSKVAYVEKLLFKNWGETVENTPAVTFIPKTVVGVQNIVKYAKEQGKKVRCSGYRHTWSDLFSNDDEILISLLPLDIATELPSVEGKFEPGEGHLQQIRLIPESIASDKSTALCKIGTATTNEQFREWCLSKLGGAKLWALPLNVIMVEVTYGGSVSPMSHGAGITHPTLSDLVAEVEFVDPNGEVHTVSDPELLKAAAGAIGMLGVVTAYTLRLDKMTYANMRPCRVPIELAVPPPQEYIDLAKKGDPRYRWIKDLVAQHSQEKIDKALAEFIRRAETDYYAEWFWFSQQRDVWVNTWKNDGLQAQATEIPNEFQIFLQWLEEWLAQQLVDWGVWQALPGDLQAKLFGFLTMSQLPNVAPDEPAMVTQLTNGLHFRRGIQNMQVYNMEWLLPIPPLPTQGSGVAAANGANANANSMGSAQKDNSVVAASTNSTLKRDWTVTQKAWWDCVLMMEAEPGTVRIACEMRIMGGSKVFLAPQRGNDLGTSSVEILTTLNTPTDDWIAFCKKLTDKWLSYTDRTTGNRLRARPHWCKQWSFLTMPDEKGAPLKAADWFRKVAYKEEIPMFMDALKKIGEAHGFTTDDLKMRFSNPYLEEIFWGGKEAPVTIVESADASRKIINRIKKFFKSCFT